MDAQTLSAAKAYRDQLNAQGIHYGKADQMVDAKFGAGTAQAINPHKVGGFAKYGGAAGDVLGKYVGPAVSLANPAIGAAITGGGRVAGKMNDPGGLKGTKVFKDVALPTAMSYAGGKLAKGAMGKAGSLAGGGDLAGEGAITGGGSAGGSAGGMLGNVWDFVKKNPALIAAGASAINGARQQGKANDLTNEALNLARQRYAEAAPIRSAIQSRLLAEPQAAPDFTDMFADAGNPYDKRKGLLSRAMR